MYPALHKQSVTASLPAGELVFAGHAEQLPAPAAEQLTQIQLCHTALHTWGQCSEQRKESLRADKGGPPAKGAYVPASHGVQLPAPVADLYVPAPHAAHATPSASAEYPASHVQSTSAVLPAVELVCAGHAVQLPAPAASLYVPAPHAAHATPSASAE